MADEIADEISDEAFVGRAAELDALQRAFDQARGGSPRLVVVEGEPGIGKTALLRRFLSLHPTATSAWAGGDETETALRYGVLDQLRAALSTGPGPSSSTAGHDAFAVGAELLALLAGDPGGEPLVVVLDDLHWADPDSARALLFWLRRLARDPILVIGATRRHGTERLGDSWARLLADTGRTQWLRMSGLTTSEVAGLAEREGTRLPERAAERLRSHTAGNPLHVSRLLAELSPESLRDPATSLPAPHSYAATVLARTERLSPDARALVAAASVLGGHAPAWVVTATAHVGAAGPALDEAVAHRLLEVRTAGAVTEVSFPHPLVRAAVYDDLSPDARRRLHLAAAAALTGPAAMLHRVEAADGLDEQLAQELALVAAEELTQGHSEEAARHLLWSADLDPAEARAGERLLEAVELLLIAGDVAGAWTHQPRVAARPPSDHRTYVLGALAAARGDLGRARQQFEAVTARGSRAAGGRLVARASSSLALVRLVLGDGAAAVAAAESALGHPDVPAFTRSIASESLALGLAYGGRLDDGLSALRPFSRQGQSPGPFEAELVMTRGRLELWAGRWAEARADLAAVVRWSKAGYPVTSVAAAYAFLAEAEVRCGDWDDAVAHIELAASLGHDLDHSWYLAHTHAVAAQLYARLGELEFARGHVAAARQAVAAVPHPIAAGQVATAEAAVAAATGDWPAVLRHVGPLLDGLGGLDEPLNPGLSRGLALATEALLETGRLDGAATALRRQWVPAEELDRCRLTARLLDLQGRHRTARQHLAETVDRAPADADPHDLALARLLLGRLRVDGGEREAAREPLRAARRTLARLQARPDLAACDAVLGAAGEQAGPPASDAPAGVRHWEGLTQREQVVARLVGRGLTNREIAGELYVSAKTVEYHLAHVFAKLGLTSRRQLWPTAGIGSEGVRPGVST